MKYALVDGVRQKASKGAKGICQGCGSEMIAKCGWLKSNHWAHKRLVNCDPWWENETEWHRSWKNHFPENWQERAFTDSSSGERHIADVHTNEGWTVEFQHSFIKPEERLSRNLFYENLIWVVDATRRKTDPDLLKEMLKDKPFLSNETAIVYKSNFEVDYHRLMKEWRTGDALIFLDFGKHDQDRLWFIYQSPETDPHCAEVYLSAISKKGFVNLLNGQKFTKFVSERLEPMRDWLKEERERRWNRVVDESIREFHKIRRKDDWGR